MATIVSWPLEEMIISLVITNSSTSQLPPGFRLQAAGLARERARSPAPRNLKPARDSCLVRESAHAHVQHQPEPGERGDHGRAAVAHEWKREPCDRRQTGRHAELV